MTNYIFIPQKDFALISEQDIYTASLWVACWHSAALKEQWQPLDHRLNKPRLSKGIKILEDYGMFEFKSEIIIIPKQPPRYEGQKPTRARKKKIWQVLNKHFCSEEICYKVPFEDLELLWEYRFPTLLNLWVTSWHCSLSNNWNPLSIEIGDSNLRKAKKILTKLDMFCYKKNRGENHWLVGNLRME